MPYFDPAWFGGATFSTGDGRGTDAHVGGLVVSSAFQPVVVLRDGTTLGHAARVRAMPLAVGGPRDWAAVGAAAPDGRVLQIDRLCRTLHAINYRAGIAAGQRLFLRVHRRLVEMVGYGHGRVFEAILGRMAIPTHAVVIELPALADVEASLLARAIASYRSLGYRVACDWTDGEPPPLSPVGAVRPDVVRLDAGRAQDADRFARQVAIVQASGAQVLAARVESADVLAQVRDAGVDFVIGFHVGRPRAAAELPPDAVSPCVDQAPEAVHA